ncbi:hypothetical protein EMIT079MI2_420031 [Bacillus sp. IT-79MI2]
MQAINLYMLEDMYIFIIEFLNIKMYYKNAQLLMQVNRTMNFEQIKYFEVI